MPGARLKRADNKAWGNARNAPGRDPSISPSPEGAGQPKTENRLDVGLGFRIFGLCPLRYFACSL